jgi:hypothetical protein
MCVQSQTINKQAQRKYSDFENAITTVRMALDELIKLSKKLKAPNLQAIWQLPDKEEVIAAVQKASRDLDSLHKNATTYKAELISRTWRV